MRGLPPSHLMPLETLRPSEVALVNALSAKRLLPAPAPHPPSLLTLRYAAPPPAATDAFTLSIDARDDAEPDDAELDDAEPCGIEPDDTEPQSVRGGSVPIAVDLLIGRRTVLALTGLSDPDWRAAPPDTRALLLDASLYPLVRPALGSGPAPQIRPPVRDGAEVSRGTIDRGAVGRDGSSTVFHGLVLGDDQGREPAAWLRLPDRAARQALAGLLERLARPPAAGGWPLPVAFELGRARLTARELASVALGDAIVLRDRPANDETIAVRVGPNRGSAVIRATTVTLEQRLVRATSRDGYMGEVNDGTAGDGGVAADPASLDEVEVPLAFEVGRLAVPLEELRGIGPGHVFVLPRGVEAGVDVLASGRRIGRGRLVRVGDLQGVQLTELFGRDASP